MYIYVYMYIYITYNIYIYIIYYIYFIIYIYISPDTGINNNFFHNFKFYLSQSSGE